MSNLFDQLLGILVDQEVPIPFERLRELSDLNTDQMAQLEQKWDLLTIERRRSIMKELGRLADENFEFSFEVINRYALEDLDAEVRCTAIQNLWESEDHSLISVFANILEEDPSLEVSAAAAEALGSFVLISETEDVDPSLKKKMENALLRSIREKKDERIYLSCLESLGFSSRKEVQGLIHEAYDTGEERMMKSALLAMGRSVNNGWQEQVIKELNSPLPSLRFEAAKAAGELELHEALQDLIELVDDVNNDVQHAAIWSISQIGGPPAGEVLSSLYDMSDDEEETQLLQDALDNLAFVEGTSNMLLFDIDETEDDPF